jgi:DNA repair protein RadA/Sms
MIGGEPGIGKSTLLLQSSHRIGELVGSVLLVSGEESAAQIRMRADRLGSLSEKLWVLSETDVTEVEKEIENLKPSSVVVDSIQTMFDPSVPSPPGSVGQVRECTQQLVRIGKTHGIAIFIVGHVTKEGSIAGPRVLEHMVDTVLYFEGERHQSYRIVRAVKNRYGSTDEIGVFEMGDQGLREVDNPSAAFLTEWREGVPGSVVMAALEGTRPLLVEIQALVTPTNLAYPRRVASGLDYNRLSLVIAVLERRAGLRLGNQDVYVSVAGGLKVNEPAADLGMALALVSAFRDASIRAETVVFGEVGLGGEVRYVSHGGKRLKEATKLGFKYAMTPDSEKSSPDIEQIPVNSVQEAIEKSLSKVVRGK